MDSLYFSLPFFAGLLGGLHCLGMCGPIVCAFGATCQADKKKEFHFGYQSGRLTSYLILGAAFGLLGTLLEQSLALARLQSAAALFGGVVMILFALSQLTGLGIGFGGVTGGAGKRVGSLFGRLKNLGGGSWYILGLMTGLLPCGLLFSIESLALATGNWREGMIVMAAFWLGSLPYLLGAGELANRLKSSFRKVGQRLLALGMLAGGAGIIYHRWTILQWRSTCAQTDLLDPLSGLHWFSWF